MEARWHPWSEEKVARRDITWDEVEEALAPPVVVRRSRDGTLKVLGVTFAGRHLSVVVVPDEDAPTVFVVSARRMTGREQDTYRSRLAKG